MDVPETPGEGRRPFGRMLLLGTALSLVGIALALWIDWFPAQGSEAASDVDLLYDILLVVSVPIFVLVMSVVVYSVWKFRARPGDERDGAPIHGDARLEVIWVVVPFIIVTVLGGYSWLVLRDIERLEPDTMRVGVVGQQFAWTFDYRDAQGRRVRSEDLVLPVGRQVEFRIRAADVLHSFWIPAFRLKSDAVPGLETNWVATPSREGTYDVVCAELCGIGHATMRQKVSVVSEERFTAWLARESGARATARGGGALAAAAASDGGG